MGRPHAVLFPTPGQGHINPMLQLAKLLHSKGFHITFVHTESSRRSILSSQGPRALDGLHDFRYEFLPDGVVLPTSRSQQRVSRSCLASYEDSCAAPLREMLARLGDESSRDVPEVTCVVYNWLLGFVLDVAEDLGIPAVAFCTMSACGFWGSFHLEDLIDKDLVPLKDESYLTNGYLDTTIDCIPGMEGIRLRDLSSFIRTTDRGDFFLDTERVTTRMCHRAHGLILNTFDQFETEVVSAIKRALPNVYTLGPLQTLATHAVASPCASMQFNFWKHDDGVGKWLDSQKPDSVIYVSFGSIATLTAEQMTEFAWGLANSGQPFLWVVRPGMVAGEDAVLADDFVAETEGRGFVTGWCSQGDVLLHASVGGFLTHGGWNSTLESVCGGVPMICCPGFAEQYTNCWYAHERWGMGMEIDREAKRDDVSRVVKELMVGEEGKKLRKNAAKWKEAAESATAVGGSSYENLDKLAEDMKFWKNSSESYFYLRSEQPLMHCFE